MKLIFSNKKLLFLPIIIWFLFFGINCDFRTPEKWENQTWNWEFTFPLLDNSYPLADIADSETIFIDTSDVFQIEFSGSLLDEDSNRVGIDEEFTSYFTIESIEIDEIEGIVIDPVFFPEEGDSLSSISNVEIPITHFSDELFGGDCFPDTLISTGFDSTNSVQETLFALEDFELFESIDYVTVDDGRLSVEVSNTFPFDISLINIEFESAGESVFVASFADLNSTDQREKLITPEDDESWVNLSEDLTISWSIIIIPQSGSDQAPCNELLTGWELTPELSETFEMDISFVLYHTKSVTGTTTDDSISQTTKIELTNESDFLVKGGKITDEFISNTLNALSIDMTNNLFAPVDFSVIFRNFFDDNDTLNISSNIGINQNFVNEESLAGYMLGHPDIEGEVIDSIEVVTTISLPSTSTTIELDNPGSLTIDDFSLSNVELEYLSAIIDSLTFDSPETNIEDLPTGFDGFDFVDVSLIIDLYNQIGIPMDLNLELLGIRDSDTLSIPIIPSIQYPDLENGDEIGDSSRTIIILNNIGQTVYWLEENGDTVLSEVTETGSTIVDILNFAPDKITMTGNAIMDGVGVLAPYTYIWGEFELIAPFTFIFNEATFIPQEYTTIDTMEASLRETIDNALVLAELQSNITNHTPMGCVISLLISDSTIYPLHFDNLVTDDISNIADSLTNDIPDSVFSIKCAKDEDNHTSYIEFLDYQDSVLFWIGRLIDLDISAPDSVDSETGIVYEPSNFVETVTMDTTQIDWITSEEPRYIVPMMTFYSSNGEPRTFLASDSLHINSHIKFMLQVDELFYEDSNSDNEPIQNDRKLDK